jgi:hypothetical protein
MAGEKVVAKDRATAWVWRDATSAESRKPADGSGVGEGNERIAYK